MEISRGRSFSVAYGILIVLFVLVTVTSAQITFSRQWVRGKYPGDSEGGESPEFQRAAKAFPKRTYTRYVRPAVHSDYVPILVSSHVLEEILERIKDSPIGSGPIAPAGVASMENAKK